MTNKMYAKFSLFSIFLTVLKVLNVITILTILKSVTINAQDLECDPKTTCNSIQLSQTIQVEAHCIYFNLIFRNMTETIIPVGAFRQCKRTLILDMSNNNIRLIKAGAFLGLASLKELYLSNNRIDFIEPGTFHTLSLLEVFVMTGNKLTTLPEYEFTSKNLKYFNINDNLIDKLPDTALLNLKNVELVDLSLNKLSFMSSIALSDVRPGAKIVLNNNQLESLAFSFNVTSGRGYTVLEASGNIIKHIANDSLGDFHRMRLSVLDLGYNFIDGIDSDALDAYQSLRNLYLNHNRIKYLSPEVFKTLNQLTSLDLSHNLLTSSLFQVKLPGTVIYLNYSHNQIDEVTDYHWLPRVKRRGIYLNLSHNKLKYLDSNRVCEFIGFLDIDFNDWKCDILYAIVRNLEMRNIDVLSGYNYVDDNVDGIKCDMGDSKILDRNLLRVKEVLNKDTVHELNTNLTQSNSTILGDNNNMINETAAGNNRKSNVLSTNKRHQKSAGYQFVPHQFVSYQFVFYLSVLGFIVFDL